jgi:DDE superfamily endonuclease
MLRGLTLPGALSRVLATFRPCFTAPTFEVFTALVAGLFAQSVSRTVCGMLTGAALARVWHHRRVHRFFSTARWCPRQVGLLLAEMIVTYLLVPGAPIMLAVDDTLFRRRGKKVHAVGWFHDGAAAGSAKSRQLPGSANSTEVRKRRGDSTGYSRETGRVVEYFESVATADKHRYVYEFDAPSD